MNTTQPNLVILEEENKTPFLILLFWICSSVVLCTLFTRRGMARQQNTYHATRPYTAIIWRTTLQWSKTHQFWTSQRPIKPRPISMKTIPTINLKQRVSNTSWMYALHHRHCIHSGRWKWPVEARSWQMKKNCCIWSWCLLTTYNRSAMALTRRVKYTWTNKNRRSAPTANEPPVWEVTSEK